MEHDKRCGLRSEGNMTVAAVFVQRAGDKANSSTRTQHEDNAQGQNVLSIRSSQAGHSHLCRGDPDERQEGVGGRGCNAEAEEGHGRKL